MKRSRDDVFLSTQIKRAAVSPRGEQSRQVQMSTASSDQRLTQNDALSYLKDIKEHFQDRKDKYQDFLDVMKDFKSQRIDTSGVIMRVKELFKGNRDLILGFNAFLPKGFKITLPLEDEPFLKKKPVDFEEAISFVNKIKARFQGDDRVYKAFLEILNMYRKDSKSIKDVYQEVSLLFQDHADLLVEFTHFLPDTTGAVSIQNADSGRNHILHGDDRGSPMTIARPTHVEKKPALLDGPVNHRDSEQYEKDKEKGEDRQKNDWEHEDSLGHRNRSSCRDDVAINQQRGMPEVESDFRDKVKDRLGDPDIDEKFADCLRSFKSKIVSAAQFRILVSSLLGTHADISEACENFVTYVERNGSFRNNKQVYRSLKIDRDGDDHDWEDQETKRDHDTRERDRHDRGLGQKIPTCASKEKFLSKPVHELDLSNYESCTPSYKLLPENYPIPSASWRTKTDAKVLNDHWVSVTSGSEDYSFKHMRKNQYEESLNRCEDDRFELDMLLESVNSTAKRVEELLDVMNAHTYKFEASFCIEDHLTAVHLRCIERLYGDHGLDVMDVLRKNAPLALPVILTRLKQKQEEWSKCRADFNKVWAEIYSKNYHKSLDYRSFYFKQQDTKNLSAKALVAEIKEMIEKTQSEDEMVLSIAGGYTQPTKPHMEFEFTDLEIQEDINQLMKYSCGEVCTPEQCDKVMKIWTTFLEPLLGVSSCPTEEDKNNEVEANNCTKQNSNQNGADEFANCKPAEISKSGDEMPPEDSIAGGACANNGNTHDGSSSAYASKSGILCDESPVAPGEDNMNMEIDSAEAGHANTDRGMKPTPSQEPKDSDLTKLTSRSTDMVLDEVNVEKHHEGNETRIKVEREEGELSPSRNLEENAFDGNIDIKEEQTLSKIDPSAMETGGGGEEEMCVEEAGLETNANATDGGEESARVSSDSENATENGDDSVSESANGEEFSPEEPDDDENDKKAESDEEADMEDVDETEGGMLNSDRLLRTIKPLTMNLPGALKCKEKITHIFYGNDSFYILFRLHQMLYERMKTAKWHSSSPENKRRFSNDGNSADPYARFKDALQSLLNGSSDNAKYEDECRSLLGAQSYILFTLDKLIHKLVKQLQFIALEEMENKLIQLYTYENSRSPETFSNAVYCENARFLLLDDNLYRMEFFPGSKRFTIQMMRDELNKVDPIAVSMDPGFASYLNDELLAVPDSKQNPGVFLERNKKLYSSGDEDSEACKAMEDLVIRNGVEMKVNCSSLKISYVLNTEDFLYRPKTRRKALYGPRKPRVRLLSRCKWMLKK